MKIITTAIAAIAIASTAGCASVNQAYSAAGASALVDARTASDNVLKTNIVGLCMTPYDTIARNPSVAPGIMALCLPAGAKASPASVLDVLNINQKAKP